MTCSSPRASFVRILLTAWIVATLPLAALADDAKPSIDDPWEFTITPYGWLIAVDGTIDADDTVLTLDIPFGEILDDLQFAAFLEFEARKGPWFIGFDGWGSILTIRTDSEPMQVGFGPTTIQDGPLSISIPEVQTTVGPLKTKTRLNVINLNLVGGYRVLTMPLHENSERVVNLDLFAGIRMWRVHANIELNLAPVTVPGFDVSGALTPPRFPNRPIDLGDVQIPSLTTDGFDETIEFTDWWIDPVVGLKASADITDRIVLGFLGDIGGFAIGSASEFTWKLQGAVGYHLSESWTLSAGYRVIQINRGGGGFDGQVYGPVVGASYRWGGGGS